jgi:beta-galactosidase
VEDNDQLPPTAKATVKAADQIHAWNAWGELLAPRPETETLAAYADQFFSGTAAVVTRRLGQGTVTYLGVWTNSGALERQILRTVYQRAGARILDLPDYVFAEWRDGFWIGVNYSSRTAALPVPSAGKVLLGSAEIKPGEVAVWKD